MSKYVVTLGNGLPLGIYSSIAKRDAAIREDALAHGDRGPYQDDTRKESLSVLIKLKVGGYGGAAAPTAPVVTDTQAPSRPLGLSALAGVDQITWSWDQSADINQGVIAPVGVSTYRLDLDGVVTSVAAPSSNILAAPTFTQIGISGAAAIQVGNTWQISGAGNGIDGTSDQISFLNWSITGDFKLSVKVDAFTGAGSEYAYAGLMARDSTAAGSRYVAFYKWLAAQNKGVQAKRRLTLNGASATFGFANGNGGPAWLQMERVNNTITYRYSFDGGEWQVYGSETAILNATVLVGGFMSDLGGAPVTLNATLLELINTPVARVQHVQSVTSGPIVGKVLSRDANTIDSLYSPTVSETPDDPPVTGAMKMNFGHGFWYLPPNNIDTSVPPHRFDNVNYRNAYLAKWAGNEESTFKVIQVVGYWKSYEGDTRGSYKFNEMKVLLDYAASVGKSMFFTFQTVVFGSRGPDNTQYPQYVLNEHGIVNLVNHTLINQDPNNLNNPGYNQGSSAKSWEAATCDDINRVVTAFLDEFDDHPGLEGFTFGETSLQINNNHPAHTASYSPTFSNQAIYNELIRAIPLLRSHAPTTVLRLGVNDFPENLMVPLYQVMKQWWWAQGGPDIWPGDNTQGDRVYAGLNSTGVHVYEDLRDIIPFAIECQYQSFQGQWTMDQLWNATFKGYSPTNGDFTMPSMKTRYCIWYINETGHVDWLTHEKPYILAHPQIYEGNTLTAPKPTAYP